MRDYNFTFKFPFRQKILIGLTIFLGALILWCCINNYVSNGGINILIFFYSFSVPFFLLIFPTIIDLNENKIFLVWLAFSLLLLIISFTQRNSDKFLITRSPNFDQTSKVNLMMTQHSTSALKTLFFF